MGNDFMQKTLVKYIKSGFLKKEDRILVVCGGGIRSGSYGSNWVF